MVEEINKRYSGLAESNCCLSCGGAVNYVEAQKGEVCVDLGCGRGNDVLRLAEKVGDEGFVYGIDISDGMITKARENAAKFDVKNVEFIQCELEKLTIPQGRANVVISNCVLNHASNKQKVWHEIYKVLKYGGRFIVSDIYSIEPVPAEFRNDPSAVAECWAGAVPKEEYLLNIQRAGFIDVEIIEESQPYQKGKIHVASFTVAGFKPKGVCCCSV